jgi:hypothetical protein
VIVAHHGLGEEVIAYAVAGGSGAASAAFLVWRVEISRLVKWLRRR